MKLPSLSLIILIAISVCSADEVKPGKPKPLTLAEQAEIYKYSARRHAISVQIIRLQAEQGKIDEILNKLIETKRVPGWMLNEELEYVEQQPVEPPVQKK